MVTYSDFRARCCTNLPFVLRLAEKLTSRKFPEPVVDYEDVLRNIVCTSRWTNTSALVLVVGESEKYSDPKGHRLQ